MGQVQTADEPREDPRLALDLRILRGMCHAFGSSRDVGEACREVTRWVQSALPDGPTTLGIFALDDRGRLDRVGGQTTGGRALIAARRAAVRAGKPRFVHLERSNRGAALLPLVCRGERVGLMQVTAPSPAVLGGWSILEAISSRFAAVLKNFQDRDRATREVSMLEQVTTLMQELVKVERPEDAVRTVMNACHTWGYQVAAWHSDSLATELKFFGVRGLGKEGRNKLRSQMRVLDRQELCDPNESGPRRLLNRFSAIVGLKDPVVLNTPGAVLILGGVPDSARPSLKMLEVLLQDVLIHVRTLSRAQARDQDLDLGLAWAAHEIKQPLVSVKAFVDRLLQMPARNDEDRAWLSDSFQEVERLIMLIEDVLRWPAGGEAPNHQALDLSGLVQRVVQCRPGWQGRISFETPGPVLVSADEGQLGAAIRNLIDNALAYSPDLVEVSVHRKKNQVVVSVKDHGPGIPIRERRRVFDPFVRGEMGLLTRNGSGLGLYIARRVAEAHKGAVYLESNGSGSTFNIRLPADKS